MKRVALAEIGIEGSWTAADEYYYTPAEGIPALCLVKINPAFYRPAEVDRSTGRPAPLRFDARADGTNLVKMMVRHDIALLS